MYDQDNDGVLKEEEIVALLYKISSQSLKAMSKSYLEGLVRQTITELDQAGKGGLNFREFKQIFDKRQDLSRSTTTASAY